jgi:hypothetical protein
MKKLFLAVLILFTQKIFADGGMDGGGGGTLPAHPVPVYKVQEIVHESKQKLLYLFNDYEMRLKYGTPSSLLSKLFLGPRKVQEVLNDLRVEIRTEKPCLTSQGTEVDGSIYGIKPNTICISAFRISQKIDLAMAEREILALLAHEVSHFMGSDELEATELQKDIAWDILNAPQGSEIDPEKLRNEISDSLNFLRKTIEETQKARFDSASEWLSRTLFALTRFEGSATSSVFRVFNPREGDYQDLLRTKVIWARNYLKTVIAGPNQAEDQKEYEARFVGHDYFFLTDDFFPQSHFYANEKIYKIKSATELVDLLKALEHEYEVRSVHIWQSSFGNNWLNVNGHLTKTFANPWGNFTGVYTVKNSQCSSNSNFNKDLKEIKVYFSGETLFFGKAFTGGYSNDRIELGAYNVNTYLNDYGLISSNKVYMTHEMGGSWSDRTYLDRTVSKIVLEAFEDQSFKIVIENTFEDQDVTKPDSKNACVLTGMFQK